MRSEIEMRKKEMFVTCGFGIGRIIVVAYTLVFWFGKRETTNEGREEQTRTDAAPGCGDESFNRSFNVKCDFYAF